MLDAVATLVAFFREAWVVMTGFVVMIVAIGGMYQMLRVMGSSAFGARYWVAESIGAIVSMVMLGLFAFLGAPAMVKAAASIVPHATGCGPLSELGLVAAWFIIAIGAVRMMWALVMAIAASAVGGGSGMAKALVECGGVLMASLVASLAGPIAAIFFDVC